MGDRRQQNQITFARTAGVNEPRHPERWLLWLHSRASKLERDAKSFERAIVEACARLVPLSAGRNRTVDEVFPKPGRARTRRAWQAFWIGEGIRHIELAAGFWLPGCASGLESLAVGGYFGDLIATIALAVQHPSAETLMDAGRITQPPVARTLAVPGVHGWSTVVPDYQTIVEKGYRCLFVRDTEPFNAAFARWIDTDRQLRLPWLFETARSRVEENDEAHALELLWDATALRAMEASELVGVSMAEEFGLTMDAVLWKRSHGDDDVIARRRMYGSDGSPIFTDDEEIDQRS
jgi:hypothetical protein